MDASVEAKIEADQTLRRLPEDALMNREEHQTLCYLYLGIIHRAPTPSQGAERF
jgi:hypothetical protein